MTEEDTAGNHRKYVIDKDRGIILKNIQFFKRRKIRSVCNERNQHFKELSKKIGI